MVNRLYKRAEYIGLVKTAAYLLQYFRIKQAASLNSVPGVFKGGTPIQSMLDAESRTGTLAGLAKPGTNLMDNIKAYAFKQPGFAQRPRKERLGLYRDIVATLNA